MSFLEKFKGKTQQLKKHQVSQILGEKSNPNNRTDPKNQLHLLSLSKNYEKNQQHTLSESVTLNTTKKTKNKQGKQLSKSQNITKSKKQDSENTASQKKIIQNPFLVLNEYYLDEQEHQAALKRKKQEEVKQRLEKQRKKRQQIKQKLMQSMRNSPKLTQKYAKKQWKQMGGLGANIGGQEWTKKKILQQKMLKFAEEIKKMNLEKVHHDQSDNLRYNKSMTQKVKDKQSISDPRTLGITYSKKVPKPTFYTLDKTKYNRTQQRTYNSDFQSPAPRFVMDNVDQPEQAPLHPNQNQFSNLKLQRHNSQLQRLQNKHKQFKRLLYQSNF